MKPKVITICGSSRFIQEIAVLSWWLERDEGALVFGLHLLPDWYTTEKDHLAESEGIASHMDELHFQKIDRSDEVFVVDLPVEGAPYTGDQTRAEIEHARQIGVSIRFLSSDPLYPKILGIRP